MQVDATFSELGSGTLELRMSRSSPGRYSLHDFAKNVYDVHAFGADGREVPTTRPDPYGWNVSGHGGRVTVKYKVYGDRVDGTYLAVDETHAHINMPAAIMWAHGLDDRPVAVTFEQPSGKRWQVATQLHGSGLEFTAPNLQYLMDSPSEFGPVAIRQFTVGPRTFRFAVHHTGTDAELDGYVKDVEKIVREEGVIYGEFPEYEPGYYTFLADYLPWASGDGMEHRNSTVMTAAQSIANGRDASARHGGPRVLPLLERRAHPARVARTVRLRSRQRVGRALARRRLHAVLRSAGAAARSARRRRVDGRAPSPTLSRP